MMISTTHFDCLSSSNTPSIVLLNGWAMHANVWQPMIVELQVMTSVMVVDIKYSEVNVDHVDTLHEVIIQALPKPCILMGWSLGGMLATALSEKFPQCVAGLITLSANAKFVADSQWCDAMPANTFDQFFQSLLSDANATQQQFFRLVIKGDQYRREQKRYLNSMANDQSMTNEQQRKQYEDGLEQGLRLLNLMDNRQYLSQIQCPALHVFGQEDALVPVSAANAIALLNNQHQVQILPDRGHLLHVPPKPLVSVINQFLSESFHA